MIRTGSMLLLDDAELLGLALGGPSGVAINLSSVDLTLGAQTPDIVALGFTNALIEILLGVPAVHIGSGVWLDDGVTMTLTPIAPNFGQLPIPAPRPSGTFTPPGRPLIR